MDIDIIFTPQQPTSKSDYDFATLLEQYKGNRATDWSIPEAFICLLLSAVMSDGAMSQEELIEVQALSKRSKAVKTLSQGQLADINKTVKQRLKDRPAALQEACETLSMDMRLPVFAHCVDVILADGQLLQPEAEYLNRITAFLKLDPNEVRRVMEVLLIKNRY